MAAQLGLGFEVHHLSVVRVVTTRETGFRPVVHRGHSPNGHLESERLLEPLFAFTGKRLFGAGEKASEVVIFQDRHQAVRIWISAIFS